MPSENVTYPVGIALPLEVTVAVMVTDWPCNEEDAEDPTEVVVELA